MLTVVCIYWALRQARVSVRHPPPQLFPSHDALPFWGLRRHLLLALALAGLAFATWEKVCISACKGGEVGGFCE